MEENKKMTIDELNIAMEKIADAIRLDNERQGEIDNKYAEMREEVRPVYIEEQKEEIKKLKEQQEEMEEMTDNAIKKAQENIAAFKKDGQIKYNEAMKNAMQSIKAVEKKLENFKKRGASDEVMQMAEKAAKKETEKQQNIMNELKDGFEVITKILNNFEQALMNKDANEISITFKDLLNADKKAKELFEIEIEKPEKDKNPQDKEPENKEPENKEPENKEPENKEPENKEPQGKKPEDRKTMKNQPRRPVQRQNLYAQQPRRPVQGQNLGAQQPRREAQRLNNDADNPDRDNSDKEKNKRLDGVVYHQERGQYGFIYSDHSVEVEDKLNLRNRLKEKLYLYRIFRENDISRRESIKLARSLDPNITRQIAMTEDNDAFGRYIEYAMGENTENFLVEYNLGKNRLKDAAIRAYAKRGERNKIKTEKKANKEIEKADKKEKKIIDKKRKQRAKAKEGMDINGLTKNGKKSLREIDKLAKELEKKNEEKLIKKEQAELDQYYNERYEGDFFEDVYSSDEAQEKDKKLAEKEEKKKEKKARKKEKKRGKEKELQNDQEEELQEFMDDMDYWDSLRFDGVDEEAAIRAAEEKSKDNNEIINEGPEFFDD